MPTTVVRRFFMHPTTEVVRAEFTFVQTKIEYCNTEPAKKRNA